MGFSIAGSGGIIFVALIVTFSILSGAFYSSIESYEVNLDRDSERRISRLQTELDIKSIRYNRTDNSTIIEVKNTGSTTLNATHSDMILDGSIVPEENVTYNVVDRKGYHWSPNMMLEIKIEDEDLEYYENIADRVESKVRHGIELPGSISSNSDYTYVVEEGDVAKEGHIFVYDHRNNLINQITDNTELVRANDISSTTDNLYVVDEQERVLEFDRVGDEGEELIPEDDNLTSPRAISVTEENPEDYIYVLDNESEVSRFHLNGTYKDTPLTGLQDNIDIYVTDHIYLVNSTADTIDRYDLDGNDATTLIEDDLESPTNVTVSDQHFANPRIYVVDENSRIEVFDVDGDHIDTIENQLGSNLWGIDVHGRIFVSNGFNGWYRLYLGTEIKIALQNGITENELI